MKCLIDGDIILYRVGFTTQDTDFGIARWRANETISNILSYTNAKEFEVWLSDDTTNSWRYQIYPEYKQNRTQEKPKHYEALKEYLVTEWEARIAHNQEADDALGIAQRYCIDTYLMHKDDPEFGGSPFDTIIASIDKDLLQVPGNHFNFVKNSFCEISPEEGLKNFYTQVLMGDRVDNIKGCPGIGEKKAFQALLGLSTGPDMYTKVVEVYLKQYALKEPLRSEDQVIDYLVKTAQVLKIKQSEDEGLWQPPEINETTVSEREGKGLPEEDGFMFIGAIP